MKNSSQRRQETFSDSDRGMVRRHRGDRAGGRDGLHPSRLLARPTLIKVELATEGDGCPA
jgi:hypothetical protein